MAAEAAAAAEEMEGMARQERTDSAMFRESAWRRKLPRRQRRWKGWQGKREPTRRCSASPHGGGSCRGGRGDGRDGKARENRLGDVPRVRMAAEAAAAAEEMEGMARQER